MSTSIACFLLIAAIISLSTGSRILLLPYSYGSHVLELATIGRSLMDRGHDVHIVVSPSLPNYDQLTKEVPVITHHLAEPDFHSFPQEEMDQLLEKLVHVSILEDLRTYVDGFIQICSNPLSDKELFKKLGAMQFDLALVDLFAAGRCLAIIPYRLGIPFINVLTYYEPWLQRNAALPSFVPFNMYWSKSTDMNFWERLDNTYRMVEWTLFPRVPYMEDYYLKQYYGDKPIIPIDDLNRQALLWLVNTDFAIDYPRPTMPNEVLVGGLTTREGEPLTDDLEKFMTQNQNGVIVVSFGSMNTNLPKAVVQKMLQAFEKVKYGVIWRYPVLPPENIPSNVKLLTWLPQQDLLAHHRTKLFITHCGMNGQFEGLYHAKPMVLVPLVADQQYNAKRAEYRGFGKILNILEFTADQLLDTIHDVIHNDSYQNNIQKASKIFRSAQMSPLDRATWWVEHVIDNGGQHLRAHALEMPWYQYLMLDIFLFVFLIIHAFCIVIMTISYKCFKILTKHYHFKNQVPAKNCKID